MLLGADPLADFPDRDLATRALAGARMVIAIDLFLTESASKADVVFAAAGYAEVDGTTTNVEGRVTTLNRKVTPPGTARADWMIAGELATRLGADLGFESAGAIWDEIERLSPVHDGVTSDRLTAPGAADGIVVPLPSLRAVAAPPSDVHVTTGDPDEVEEPETPPGPPGDVTGEGTDDAEAQADAAAASSRAQAAESDESTATHEAEAADASADAATATASEVDDDTAPIDGVADAPAAPAGRPAVLTFTGPDHAIETPPTDAYSLRLVTVRKLYDRGTLTQQSRSIAGLAAGSALRANPYDLERLGLADGGRVRVTSARSAITTTVTPDDSVPRGTVALGWNQGDPSPSDLIDVALPVTDLRVETTS